MHPKSHVIFNTAEAAHYCGISPRTLEKYRTTGGGPPYIKLGSAVRYDVDDLNAWIHAHRKSHTGEMS